MLSYGVEALWLLVQHWRPWPLSLHIEWSRKDIVLIRTAETLATVFAYKVIEKIHHIDKN